jgi:hypothetical protein
MQHTSGGVRRPVDADRFDGSATASSNYASAGFELIAARPTRY